MLTSQELSAWRGFLETHARVTRALDAEMRAEHGLPVSSYEVLMFLADAPVSGCGWPRSPTACCSAAAA